MALSIKAPETEKLARKLAALKNITITEAVTNALRKDLAEETQRKKKNKEQFKADIQAIAARIAGLPVLDDRTPDEIIGYDENGIPT